MSICNGDISDSSTPSRVPNTPRNVHFGSVILEEEIKVSTASVYEAQPFNGDLESAANRILIQHGKIVNDDLMYDADVYIENGKIVQIGKNLVVPSGYKVIDAKNRLVIPGGIDPHTHFQFPFMGSVTADDFYTGSKAALAGGTTMIMDFVIDPNSSLLEAYEKWRSFADEKICCDYGLHVAISSLNENTEADMEILTKQKGINSFKLFMCSYNNLQLRDPDLLEILNLCGKYGSIAQVHAENGDIIAYNTKRLLKMGVVGPEGHLYSRPEDVEAEATYRAIVLADQVNCPLYVVHVMSKSAADIVAREREKGKIVYGEVIAAAVGTDGSHYFDKCWNHAAAHVLSPPLRPDPTTSQHLINLLSSGSLQVTGSDHCTFNSDQKALGAKNFSDIPNGVCGVEDRMSIFWEKAVMSGIMDPCKFVAVTSTNAAKIFNIYPRKGRIQVGSDADIVIWDPHGIRTISSKTHHQAVDFNIFEGLVVRGIPEYVISQGKIVVNNGEVHVTQGCGTYIQTPPFSPHVFASMQQRKSFPSIFIPACDVIQEGEIPPPPHASTPVQRVSEQNAGREFHSRAPTRSGGRHMQDSSFSLSGAQIDDARGTRSGIKVNNPPGGKSSGLW